MVYFQDNEVIIRQLEEADAQVITQEEIRQGWNASVDKYLMRLKDMKEQRAIALVAEYQERLPDISICIFRQAERSRIQTTRK